jgi:hypothetical protein
VAGTNGFAIASLILAIFGCVGISLILAIAFGILALSQLKKREQRGRGLAIAGLSIAGVWIVAIAIATVVAIASAPSPSNATVQPGVLATTPSGGVSPEASSAAGPDSVPIADLQVGQCVKNVTEGLQVSRLLVVPCADAHEAEVVALFDLPAGAYPGETAVDKKAGDGCADRLEAYAPGSSNNPDLDVFYFSPLKSDWDNNDRSVICMAVNSKPVTGSVKS